MTEQELVEKVKKAKKYYHYRYGKHEDADDFGGFVAEQILKGRDPTTTNRIFSIDYIRHVNPYSRHENKELIMDEFNRHLIDKDLNQGTDLSEIISDADLDRQTRALAFLYYQYGLSKREIAVVFNYSPTHIANEIILLNKRLKEVHS